MKRFFLVLCLLACKATAFITTTTTTPTTSSSCSSSRGRSVVTRSSRSEDLPATAAVVDAVAATTALEPSVDDDPWSHPPPPWRGRSSSQHHDAASCYVRFARDHPFLNNVMIASVKTAVADVMAQTVIAGAPLTALDLPRCLLFFLFGGVYSGCFQYLYQVQVFRRLFDVDKFTEQTWMEKARDQEGLRALAAQTALDLTVLTAVYLPAFYIFKASVFEGSVDPNVWFGAGWDTYVNNFTKDEFDLVRVWLPADLVCFSVALYLRLPVRHIVSFAWTAYLSFTHGGH